MATPEVPPKLPEPKSLEQQKWEFEKSVKERELALKEREQTTKEGDLELKRSEQAAARWKNPLLLAFFGAVLAALSNSYVSFENSKATRELEKLKAEQARVLEMIKT